MEQPGSPSPWATVRFRRAKDVRGWTLLGIPTLLYVQVLEQLFERQARFIEKHHQGEFVSVLFEAPVALAAHLALRFPAPADSEVLSVNAGGDRILHGKAATSAKAQHQAKATGPSLAELARQDAFWEAVRSLASSNPSQNPSQNDQPTEPWEEDAEDSEGWETDDWPADEPLSPASESQDSNAHPIPQTAVNKILGHLTVQEAIASQALREIALPEIALPEIAPQVDQPDRLPPSSFPPSSFPPSSFPPSLPSPPPPSPAPPDALLQGDPFHISLLCQGVEVWNRWRTEHPHLRPNLRGAYLNHRDLHWADLHDADLRFAFLFYSDLSEADLQNASLLGADLIHANLEAADLRGAILCGAYLSYANLNRADLRYTDLRGAFLYGAHLHETWLPQSGLPSAEPRLARRPTPPATG